MGLGLAGQSPQYTLSLDGDSFVVSGKGLSERVPLRPEVKAPPKFVAYRKEDGFAVWDQRGLTLRRGDRAKSFRLEDIPISPKIFEPEEIESVQHEVAQGRRILAAAGISGSKRIGQRVYFLVRWNGADQKPAFEALVQVDLDASELKPTLVGKVEGLTGSTLPIDDKLFLVNGGIAAVTKRTTDWGVATYSFSTKSFDFVSLGQKLSTWYPSGLYMETTSYDTKMGGLLDRDSLQTNLLFEDRGDVQWLDGKLPAIAIERARHEQVLRSCDSGLEQTFSDQAQIRRTMDGILAWSPADQPKHAVLLSYSRWAKLATWNSGSSLTQPPRRRRPKKQQG